MNKILITILAVACLPLVLTAQRVRGFCSTDHTAIMERLEENKKNAEHLVHSRMPVYVPITWHRVGRNDGSGKVTYKNILDQMCSTNEHFADMGIVFYIKDINEINNTQVYNEHRTTINGTMRAEFDDNAINVYVPNNANTSSDGLGTTLGYYDPARDLLVMRRSEVSNRNSTFTHEVGHFLGLPHPHLGWDAEPYEGSENAPTFSPGGIRTELVDGSNCEVAGDRICDTPPDYNLGFGWPDCNYTGGAKDPNGVPLDPQEINFMAYFLNCQLDEYIFTPMQKDIMQADYESNRRAYLRTSNFVPNLAEVGSVTNVLPANRDTSTVSSNIQFEWEAAENAEYYILEIDRLPTFALSPITVALVNGETNYTLPDELDLGKTYYWRVTPYSSGDYCVERSAATRFVVGESVSNVSAIDELAAMDIYPNPVRSGQSLTLDIQAIDNTVVDVVLMDLSGRVQQRLADQSIRKGAQRIQLETSALSRGVYQVSLIGATGVRTERVVVLGNK